jgi:Ras-related protein Rab-7A
MLFCEVSATSADSVETAFRAIAWKALNQQMLDSPAFPVLPSAVPSPSAKHSIQVASAPRGDETLKVVVLGDVRVGKTCLLSQFVNGRFTAEYTGTVGASEFPKQIDIEGMSIDLQIWDIAGQEVYRNLAPSYMRGSDCGVLVYDMTERSSFENITQRHSEFCRVLHLSDADDFPFLLLGNKSDLSGKVVDTSTAREFAHLNGDMLFFEVSAATSDSVETAFEAVVRKALKRKADKRAAAEPRTEDSVAPSGVAGEENVSPISVLARKFCLEELLSTYRRIQASMSPDLITTLCERISRLEQQVSTQDSTIKELRETIARLERRMENLLSDLEIRSPISPPTSIALKEVECPFKKAQSVDGIICYLTRKHGGNVVERGIVDITSKSVDDDAKSCVGNVADLCNEDSDFRSKQGANQWICWNFKSRRIRPTHYTIRSPLLRSWVIEGSSDGINWEELGRETNNKDLNVKPNLFTFGLTGSSEYCFIRLTQTSTNHGGGDILSIGMFELFGTILE